MVAPGVSPPTITEVVWSRCSTRRRTVATVPPRRAFTLVEVVIVLIMVGVLVSVMAPPVREVAFGSDKRAQASRLAGAGSAARAVAARQGNNYTFPEDLVDQLNASDPTYVPGPSTGIDVVSVYRFDATTVFFATRTQNESCLVAVDSLDDDVSQFGIDADVRVEDCSAEVASTVGDFTGSDGDPGVINLYSGN
jgi:prepilin-type N-terminal cleavage/methylation domain-containing protein